MKYDSVSMLLGVLFVDVLAVHAAGAERAFDHFITRQGDRLMDGAREYRFIGANMPGLMLPYDWTLSLPGRLRLPTAWEQEDAFKTLDQMNLRVVRTWNLPICARDAEPQAWHYVLGPGKFNEEAFKCVDRLFALANKYKVRVIFDLTADCGDYLGGVGTYAAHRGKKRAEFFTDPQVKDDYKATIRHVLTRTNTITGVPYKDDKCILAWQSGNEIRGATIAWEGEIAGFIKTLAPHHLVIAGCDTRIPADPPVELDIVTRHYYSGDFASKARGDGAAAAGKRPLIIGEFGPYIDGKNFTQDNVVAKVRAFLDAVQATPSISGALLWSMYFHHQDGGFWWHQIMTYPSVASYHWPGFASAEAQREAGLMQAMREAAFRIEGKAAPPLPVPDAPELLPIGDVPMLSWRGSAGATGYDIERGEPWTVIATNVCDADVAYRPLFSDTTARPGQAYSYRIVARNASGASKPSNIVGPITIKRVCFVDELQDFSRVARKSDGLTLTNAYNAMYAEHLFRAKGDAGDWLAYKIPGSIDSIKVVAFCPGGQVADLRFQAGDTVLQPDRAERPLPSPPGGAAGGKKRTLIEYQCPVPPGQSQLKVLWTGPAELDRVEIYVK
jgi:hypothetical protein